MTLLLPLLLLPLFPLSTTAQTCYYPDGSRARDYTYVPCVNGTHSTCCIPSEGDVCLSNNICFYTTGDYPFRGACTDSTWSSNACPQFCTGTNPSDWEVMTDCGAGKYCCGLSCCEDEGVTFEVGVGQVVNDYGQLGISVPGAE